MTTRTTGRTTAGALLPLAVAAALAGCSDDGTAPEDGTPVTIAFAASAAASLDARGPQAAPERAVGIAGENGTLSIERVLLVVAEFELEGSEDACLHGDDDDCEDFEALPALLDLPLDGGEVAVATHDVPPGVYVELEFEVEDLDDEDEDDGEDAAELAAIRAIRSQLESAYPGVPREASAVVEGTFTPADGGAARPFTVFFDAEIEIEMDLVPPLVVEADGSSSRTLTVVLDPTRWFRSGAGDVLDLSRFDGQLLEFEDELEAGFEGVEIDDD